MAKGAPGVFETARMGARNEDELAFKLMFPAKNQFQQLQMMARHQHRSMVPLAIMGVFRRMYKSRVLSWLQEELNVNKIALEGLGRIEGAEIVVAKRAARDMGDKEE